MTTMMRPAGSHAAERDRMSYLLIGGGVLCLLATVLAAVAL